MDASRIKILVMDVDGTLTDGRIHMGPEGELFKTFDVHDGYAIAQILPELGVTPVIITGRSSDIVTKRCAELGIRECHQGVDNKLAILLNIAKKYGCILSEVAYIGDDLNDLQCLRAVHEGNGLAICPADAPKDIKDACDYTCGKPGGNGAIREVIELIRRGMARRS